MREGLKKTGQILNTDITELFSRKIDDALFEELEERLLLADVGVEATTRILAMVTEAVRRKDLQSADALLDALEDAMVAVLEPVAVPLMPTLTDAGTAPVAAASSTDLDSTTSAPAEARVPFAILVVGINGAGKTTTIGKLAHRFRGEGRSVVLAAGDTFRAAAVEQLQTWGARLDVPVIAQGPGADSAAVIFDALQAAKARRADVVIADTAGRLHTQNNLMDEIRKVKRVMARFDSSTPHETLLVLDGGTGQNALTQARAFDEALDLTGLVITKLDGTAKGGVLFALAERMKLPIRFIGVGEKADDLQPFVAREFVRALLGRDTA
ncbi:MAG: signal recognition particle-docking protein FtsY [Thioalkalivibrionaceae bacterium]